MSEPSIDEVGKSDIMEDKLSVEVQTEETTVINDTSTTIMMSTTEPEASVEMLVNAQGATPTFTPEQGSVFPLIPLSSSNKMAQDSGASSLTAISSTAGAAGSSCTKKRPYRRTKRPVGYNDKSSITTTTDSMFQTPLNVYDTVLQESQDLLTAAQEAQQLGRLKMSSAYLLLLHARLVGLGKRFDKAQQVANDKSNPNNNNNNNNNNRRRNNRMAMVGSSVSNTLEKVLGAELDGVEIHDDMNSSKPTTPTKNKRNGDLKQSNNVLKGVPSDEGQTNEENDVTEGKQQAVQVLAQYLPTNIELDTAMIEHLAKAAAELQAVRSGRTTNFQASNGTLATPDEFLASTSNQTLGVTNAALEVANNKNSNNNNNSIAFTATEIKSIHAAIAAGKDDPKDLVDLVPGRSEQQIKAYLRNQTQKARIAADLELPDNQTTVLNGTNGNKKNKKKIDVGNSTETQNNKKLKMTGVAVKTEPASVTTDGSLEDQRKNHASVALLTAPDTPCESTSSDGVLNSGTKKKGGRGKKPQTAAMNTVPNAVCNARALLQGSVLKPIPLVPTVATKSSNTTEARLLPSRKKEVTVSTSVVPIPVLDKPPPFTSTSLFHNAIVSTAASSSTRGNATTISTNKPVKNKILAKNLFVPTKSS